MAGALRAACEEMGAVLIRSAHSPNIKERHDCSTALFDPAGELVMQAEHIPVHLGSMPDAVAAIVGEEHRDGDLWILNDPYRGGTHLPDITLVSPVFAPGTAAELLGFAASRAHHADIGGPTPGGMPAVSATLDEEGVVIPPTRADDDVLRELAARMRNPEPAPRRPARPARGEPDRDPSACASSPSATGSSALARRDRRDPRLRRAAHPGRARRRCPTARAAPRTCSRAATARSRCGSRATLRGDALRARLRRAAPARSRATSTARSR